MAEKQTEEKAKSRVGRESGKRCPKCGSTLLTNDYGQEWCSFVGTRPCTYGILHDNNCASAYVRAESRGGGFYPCDCGFEEAHRDRAVSNPSLKKVEEMRFLTNTHDPKDLQAKMYLNLSFEDMNDPRGRERAWQRHLEWLKDKIIGEPQGTETYTPEQLKAVGMVGVYAQSSDEDS